MLKQTKHRISVLWNAKRHHPLKSSENPSFYSIYCFHAHCCNMWRNPKLDKTITFKEDNIFSNWILTGIRTWWDPTGLNGLARIGHTFQNIVLVHIRSGQVTQQLATNI